MIRLLFLLLFIFNYQILFAETIIIQSTTSTRDSGLYKYLLPFYPDNSNVQIKVIAVGTGQAIINAQNCDGNILIVHDKNREKRFIDEGYGSEIHSLMYNDYVIIGPKRDYAKVSYSSSVLDAFKNIFDSKNTFVSRSDSSGTHAAEMSIWNKLSLDPKIHSGSWYLESGQGMGPSLSIATSLDGYTISDRSSWLRFKNKGNHLILYENPRELRNDYSIILVNHDRCKNLNLKPAKKLYDWLKSKSTADLIRAYRLDNTQVFYID